MSLFCFFIWIQLRINNSKALSSLLIANAVIIADCVAFRKSLYLNGVIVVTIAGNIKKVHKNTSTPVIIAIMISNDADVFCSELVSALIIKVLTS